MDEIDLEVYNTVYYKGYLIVTGELSSPIPQKYEAYQQRIQADQIERAIKIMQSSDKARKGKILTILLV